MTLPKWATTVTPLSRTIALALFILLPIVSFYFGMQYQKKVVQINQNVSVPILTPIITAELQPTPTSSPSEKCQTDSDCDQGMTCGGSGKCAYWDQPVPTNIIKEGSRQSCTSDSECIMESACGMCWVRHVNDPVPGYMCQEDSLKPYVDVCKKIGVTPACISGYCRAK